MFDFSDRSYRCGDKPIGERQGLGRTHMLFRDANRAELERLGEVGVPSVADLFVATIQGARA